MRHGPCEHPPYPLGGDFFIACSAFEPLDHQTIITQTQAVTHEPRPLADHGAQVCVCAHRSYAYVRDSTIAREDVASGVGLQREGIVRVSIMGLNLSGTSGRWLSMRERGIAGATVYM